MFEFRVMRTEVLAFFQNLKEYNENCDALASRYEDTEPKHDAAVEQIAGS